MKIVPKIVNGVAVQHLAFRFFVTVYVSFPGSDNTANLCGGVIYDARHVVTAAHCLSQEVSPSRIIVRGMDNGNIFDKFTSRDYAAVSHIIHPMYDDITLHNDFALLRMEKAFDVGYEQVLYSTTLTQWRENSATDALYTVGHGVTETGKTSKELMIAKLARVPAEACAWNPLDLGQDFCAGSFSSCSDGFCQDSCQGDSGGPLFQLKEDTVGKSYHEQIPDGGVIVFGLTSRGAACGTNQTPGIYASLHIANEWLRALAVADDTKPSQNTEPSRNTEPSQSTKPSQTTMLMYGIMIVSIVYFMAICI